MQQFVVFLAGLLFAVGLAVSGMTQPSKVVGFLDFFGNWDPSLAFVMGGAVGINALFWRAFNTRKHPILAQKFHLPDCTTIDRPLVLGAALFGIGWGLGGYCPGPGIASLASLQAPALVFVATMAAGMFIFSRFDNKRAT